MTRLVDIIQDLAIVFLFLYTIYALGESWHDLRWACKKIAQRWKERRLKEVCASVLVAVVSFGPGGYLICEILDYFGIIQF